MGGVGEAGGQALWWGPDGWSLKYQAGSVDLLLLGPGEPQNVLELGSEPPGESFAAGYRAELARSLLPDSVSCPCSEIGVLLPCLQACQNLCECPVGEDFAASLGFYLGKV